MGGLYKRGLGAGGGQEWCRGRARAGCRGGWSAGAERTGRCRERGQVMSEAITFEGGARRR